MEMASAIQYLYPKATNLVDFIIMDNSDGQGQHIAVWNLPDPKPTEQQLQDAWLGYNKQTKLAQLSNACQNAIYGGFKGTDGHTYQFASQDQLNITQQMLLLVSDSTITTVQWKTEDAGIIPLTRAQFLAMCNDANNFKRQNMGKYWQLAAQVNACTTVDEINNIGW